MRDRSSDDHAHQVLTVHPEQLLRVEDSARSLVDVGEVEELCCFVPRDDLAVVAGVPSEKGEEVEERGRDDAEVAILLGRVAPFALRKPLAVAAQNQWQMREHRHFGAECAEQHDVLGRVREVIVAARDVRDVHVDVVDDDGEVIRRIAVGAQEHEVVDQIAFELHIAANEVMELDRTGRRPCSE